jgi:hypothetical protein
MIEQNFEVTIEVITLYNTKGKNNHNNKIIDRKWYEKIYR